MSVCTRKAWRSMKSHQFSQSCIPEAAGPSDPAKARNVFRRAPSWGEFEDPCLRGAADLKFWDLSDLDSLSKSDGRPNTSIRPSY